MPPYTPPANNAVNFALSAFTPEVLTRAGAALTSYTRPALNAVNHALASFTRPVMPSVNFELAADAVVYYGILKRWTGAAWVKAKLMVYVGGTWQNKALKRWTGSEWKLVDATGT